MAICQRCLVRQECLDFVRGTNLLVGVWGGTQSRPASWPSALGAEESPYRATKDLDSRVSVIELQAVYLPQILDVLSHPGRLITVVIKDPVL